MNRYITVGVAMLVGAGVGAAAVQSIRAQANPPAYYVAEVTLKDQNGYMTEFVPPAEKSRQEIHCAGR
jgi:hypothetical protein